MGIPLYFHTVAKTYNGILHTCKPRKCDWYFFDYNGVIHHGAQALISQRNMERVEDSDMEDFERSIFEQVWDYTTKCVTIADPQLSVGIYIDGVAPVAKINQQRKRRYLSIKRHKLLGTEPVWDTNAISPGTTFMIRLQAFLRSRIQNSNYDTRFVLSGADEPGEGEHKIFAHIASVPMTETIFIHGLDADLIMLSLMSHHPNIVLMREPTWPYNEESTQDGFIYLDIDRFRFGLLSHLKDRYEWCIPQAALDDTFCGEAKQLIETYVVCCFLLGNDFLPHAPTMSLKKNGYDELLRAARHAFETFPDGAIVENKVFMPFLTEVISGLSTMEDEKLQKINEEYMHRRPSLKADKADAYPLLDETKDKLASHIHNSLQPKRWRSLYYKHLFFSKLNDTSVVAKACEYFVTGLCWTYAYYKRLPKPYDWYYPYGYPPTLLDLKNYLQGTAPQVWDDMQGEWAKNAHLNQRFLEPAIQLLCILPIESSQLIPHRYRCWMTDHKYGCVYMYPSSYPIQTYLQTHLWECVPVLPPLDIPWIQECAKKMA